MAPDWQRGVLRLMGVVEHAVTVTAVHDLTPWYRRVTFSAPSFVRGLEVFPTLWLRLWVPDPAKGPGGTAQRGYTLVDVRPDEGTFALDMVLHDVAGPAGDWARHVAPGDTAQVGVTPAKVRLPADADHLLLMGDTTALPAVNSWLEQAPPGLRVTALLEDPHPGLEALPVHDRPGGEVRWVAPDPHGPAGTALAAEVGRWARAAGATPSADGGALFAWGAGSRDLVRTVRPVLRTALGLDRAHQFTQVYWTAGRAAG